MNIVDQRFDFTDRILNGKRFKVIFLNNTHVKWNCYYSATVEPGMQVLDECVVMTCMPQSSRHRQEFGFLHELGHLLHTYAENQISTVPASFVPSIEHIFSKTTAFSSEDISEFFADCFAIAYLLGSPYAKCDYTTYCAEDKAKILLYMAMLIEQSFPSDKRVPILSSLQF